MERNIVCGCRSTSPQYSRPHSRPSSTGVSVVSVTNPGAFANNYSRISIAGARYLLAQVSVDGVVVNDRVNGGTSQNFSQETVREFQVERFSFDLASAMGGAGGISIVTRHKTPLSHFPSLGPEFDPVPNAVVEALTCQSPPCKYSCGTTPVGLGDPFPWQL